MLERMQQLETQNKEVKKQYATMYDFTRIFHGIVTPDLYEL